MLDSDLFEYLFVLLQGIIDIIFKLFVIVQIRVIVIKVEEIIILLFDIVYVEEMKSVYFMLDVLCFGNEKEILKYFDFLIFMVDIEDVVKNML